MAISKKHQCILETYVIQNVRRQKGWRQRSQGGVQLPTGGNCAQCV